MIQDKCIGDIVLQNEKWFNHSMTINGFVPTLVHIPQSSASFRDSMLGQAQKL